MTDALRATDAILLVPLFPLLAVLGNLLLGRFWPRAVTAWVCCGAVALSFLAAVVAVAGLAALPPGSRSVETTLYPWISSGSFHVPVGILLDPLSAVMILVVTGVGFLIHLYSVGYMAHDPGFRRYFLFLNLFVFAMLVLVLGDSFLLLFVGWEGVGLASWLLIGFWFHKDAAAEAGKKAFIVNRVGDFGFLLGMLLLFYHLGTLTFRGVFAQAPTVFSPGDPAALVICLLLFLGAMGKSAQLPLHVWLPDAMEGPTPVSALIHAATMVTAGVYLVVRCHSLFELAPAALTVVAVTGLLTALFAASIALVQNDIKRVLAYSTVSQLGFMFLAAGVGAYTAAVFHLVTHAFFKALLFLGAGSVIHALDGEQDIRRMGGLRRGLPVTHKTFVVGAAAIAGIPPLAGFFSKDEILYSAFAIGESRGGGLFWLLAAGAAFMTAFYMFRLVFRVFYGPQPRTGPAAHPHESPRVMTVPLRALALLAAAGGLLGIPLLSHAHLLRSWLGPLLGGGQGEHGEAALELVLMAISVLVALSGILLAARLTLARPRVAETLAKRDFPQVYRLLLDKWRVDELYDQLMVGPLRAAALFCWRVVDAAGIDGAVNGAGRLCSRAGGFLRRAQTGLTENYALSMALGVVLILFAAFFAGVGR